jgi:LmbE family N-acetylglucosaminyl deacetylase
MEINVYKNVLVLAPHTDDGELGAGGTINKLTSSGSTVTYVAFSTAKESVPLGFPSDVLKLEVKEATSVLGVKDSNLIIYDFQVRRLNYSRQEILENLIELRKRNFYDLVLIPSLRDIHQDHSTIAAEAVRAFKGTSIWSYELLSHKVLDLIFLPILYGH